jgi:hypothetical protein
LGLPAAREGALRIRVFRQSLLLSVPSLDLSLAGSGNLARSGDDILVLHEPQYGCSIEPQGGPISFRGNPGGQCDWPASRARSIESRICLGWQ